jgi:3-dehydroquinate synthase
VEIKAAVVAADEREGGLRKSLNFGHTIGHAVEALSQFDLLHGEAIAIGMVVEADLGEEIGVTQRGTAARLRELLVRLGLPTQVPHDMSPDGLLALMQRDKKARGGQVEFALVDGVGSAHAAGGRFGVAVPEPVVRGAIRRSANTV